MKRKNIFLNLTCIVLILFASVLSINNLNADDTRRLSKNKKRASLGEDGVLLCHCYTAGYRCFCVNPPPKGPVLGDINIDN
ncbi:MAG: hypothetical protein Roseis2KO_46400 [Roseivirga sp.]